MTELASWVQIIIQSARLVVYDEYAQIGLQIYFEDISFFYFNLFRLMNTIR